MIKYRPSIQNKIKYGYYICLALIVIVSLLNYLDLKRVDKKITFSFVPDEGQIFISARSNIGTKSIDLTIKDTGIGIEPEDINKIFNPFFTTKTDGKGSGLGLFVAHEIIKEHDGIIEVNSKPGEGTVFTVKLPVKEINGK